MEKRTGGAGWTLAVVVLVSALTLQCTKPPAQSKPQKPDKEALERRVQRILQMDNVSMRVYVDDIFALADIYANEGNTEKALRLYEEALRVDSWRLDYQLKLAHLLKEHGEPERALEKAQLVAQYATDERLISEAKKLASELQAAAGASAKDMSEPREIVEFVKIVLVPIGNVDEKLIRDLKEKLEKKLGIRYLIAPETIEPGVPDRSFSRCDLLGRNCKLFRQFYVPRLRAELMKRFPMGKDPNIKGYLGITAEDIYRDNTSFLFGWGYQGYVVMSYHRFREEFYGRPPDYEKLLERTFKQAISSSFFTLSIPRCNNPHCVRAYPHDLTEHDRKSDKLCRWCRLQLEQYIERARKETLEPR